jgi:arylsulfatase A-like enzyme/Flp pilus assembly protein TadD
MPLRKFALLALLLFACHRSEPRPVPVILISIDTLRSDHLPAYGYRAIATPNIDRLARDGVVFEHAYSNVPLTLPSHATIMTGLLPAEHGVRDNAGAHLDAAKPTIASMLRARGYATGAAVSAYVLRRDSNISSGFEFYDDGIHFVEGAPTGNLQRNGDVAVSSIKTWIESHRTQPFFAFVHLFEPHTPHEPTYDADIAKSDRIAGELLDALRTQNLYDDSLIILLSDHGEGLGDHGEAEHGVLLYREALQVPLIVKLPRGERAGERVREAAQLADVLPTIAAVTGTTPPKTRGESLLALPANREIYGETLYPRIHLGWSDLRSLVRYPLHLISGPKPELYDVAADTREANDLRATRRRDYTQLTGALETFPHAPVVASRIDPEEKRKLAALGYVDAGASSKPSNVNPREHLGDLNELKEVTELMARRDYANAAKRIESLLQRNPGWSDIRDDLGMAYEGMGDFARAEETYREAIRTTPELASEFALSLGWILARQGKFDEAIEHARVAMPANAPGAHNLIARVSLARGRPDDALREAEAMRASPAHENSADVLLAEILIGQRKPGEALTALQRIRSPYPTRYWFLTGDALARLGRTDEARVAFGRAIATDSRDRDAYIALAFVEASVGNRTAAETALQHMTVAIPQSRAEADQVRREIVQRR